jgi:serine/threonine-protein kinase
MAPILAAASAAPALAADAAAPLDVRAEVGRGYLRLAQVVGGGLSGQLGRYQDANALLARAEQILAPLARAHPDHAASRRALAALRIEQSAVNLYNNNEVDRARAQAREARTMLQPGAGASLEAAALYADATRAEGDTYLWSEDYPRARALFDSGEAFIAGLPAAMQRDPLILAQRAGIQRYLGEALHNLHETEPARAALDRAVALHQAVLATRPDDPLFRRRVVTSLRYRAIVHRTNNRNELARQSIEQARTEAIRLRDRDPADIGALQLFAVVSEVYMQTLSDLGRHAEAYRIGREIRDAYRLMVDRAGNAPGQLRSLAMALRSEAEVHYNGGDYAGACHAWSEVLSILAGLERRGALTDTDRNNAQTQTRDFLRRACNPPRAGLGPRIE